MKFPNHEENSFLAWSELFPHNTTVGSLIKNDMVLHRSKPKDVESLKKMDHLYSHMLISLAEINANAEMFGGTDSDSFKIKFKNLEKIMKKLL